MLGFVELASERTGDPADEDAAAKQVAHITAQLVVLQRLTRVAQAVEQDDPSILEAATLRNNAMWPEFIISNLNRLNSYVACRLAHRVPQRPRHIY